MAQSRTLTLLSLLLLFMNVAWILVTLKTQSVIELIYNIITVSLNIIYILLALTPDSGD